MNKYISKQAFLDDFVAGLKQPFVQLGSGLRGLGLLGLNKADQAVSGAAGSKQRAYQRIAQRNKNYLNSIQDNTQQRKNDQQSRGFGYTVGNLAGQFGPLLALPLLGRVPGLRKLFGESAGALARQAKQKAALDKIKRKSIKQAQKFLKSRKNRNFAGRLADRLTAFKMRHLPVAKQSLSQSAADLVRDAAIGVPLVAATDIAGQLGSRAYANSINNSQMTAPQKELALQALRGTGNTGRGIVQFLMPEARWMGLHNMQTPDMSNYNIKQTAQDTIWKDITDPSVLVNRIALTGQSALSFPLFFLADKLPGKLNQNNTRKWYGESDV